jgi:outer membrane protein assembly factor BamB
LKSGSREAADSRWSAILVLCAAALVATLGASDSRADDWPQWMGSHRDGVWRESGIVSEFPAAGLKAEWRVDVAGGYSGPAVADGRVFVTDYVRESGDATNSPSRRNKLTGMERVLCLDAKTGQRLWIHEMSEDYEVSYPAGPRAVPTVYDGLVYVLGAMGQLTCLKAENGDVVWSRNLQSDYRVETPIWGFCGHPLVDGDRLICLVGGEGSVAVALNRHTGQETWKAVSASEPGYAPPTIIEAGGTRQLLIWDADKLNSLNPENGTAYWVQPLQPDYGMSIMAPQKHGDLLFASGIGNVGAAFRLSDERPAAELVWKGDSTSGVYCANSTPLIVDGVIYGVDCRRGQLRGVELTTGKRLWETFDATSGGRGAGHATAFLTRNGDRWFLFNEQGDLIIAKLSRGGYQELSRTHLIEPTGEAFGRNVVWTAPAFANRCVFVRNDRELACFSLAVR